MYVMLTVLLVIIPTFLTILVMPVQEAVQHAHPVDSQHVILAKTLVPLSTTNL